ncbi:MAG TPA: hypothetical protein VJ765_06365 [Chitinophagaceae bacterium]|nr:hypothetical protein [Chitinophagaceae bacterium]
MSKQKFKYKKRATKTAETPNSPASQQTGISKRKINPGYNFFKENWKQIAVLFLLATGLYIQTLSFDYVLDDTIIIVKNKFTQKGIEGIPEILSNETFKGHFGDQKELVEGGRYRPLSMVSFAIEKSITGGNAALSHLINVLLYAFTGIFLYRVLLFLFPQSRRQFISMPFAAAALFIVHPLHVEVVANIKGRDEIFAFIAELAILYYSFKWLAENKTRYLIYSALCYFLGILSKENVITFLAIVPLTAHFFSHSSLADKIKITLPLGMATVIYLIIRYAVLGYMFSGQEITNLMNNPFYGMDPGEKTATIFYTLLIYFKLLFYPHPLTHDYYPYHIPVMNWSHWAPILSLVIHLVLLIFTLFYWKRKSVLSYSIAFYFITLSIVSNLFISVGTFMNERFVYHASLGFCIAISWLLVEKMNTNRMKKNLGYATLLLGVLAFSILTYLRMPDWKTNESLNRSAIKVSYNSARANLFFGTMIWEKDYLTLPKDAGKARRKAVLDSLNPYFDKAIEILPNYSSANSMKAGAAAEYYKLDGDLENLVRTFEEVNLTGTYEKFILDYLHYINPRVKSLKDAKLLEGFYQRMISYYDFKFKNTNLPGEYRSLLKEIQGKIPGLQ